MTTARIPAATTKPKLAQRATRQNPREASKPITRGPNESVPRKVRGELRRNAIASLRVSTRVANDRNRSGTITAGILPPI
jgi:hypothetical protein